MLLQIIDKPNQSGENDLIEIILSKDGEKKSFEVKYSFDFISPNLLKDLDWYYNNYLRQIPVSEFDKNVIGRWISFGKELGDKLLGEDFQLISYRELIEKDGYDKLTVRIESIRSCFFALPWEALILPDSNFILSSVVQSFSRRVLNANQRNQDAVIEYNLTKNLPLKIVHAISRSKNNNSDNAKASNALNSALEFLAYDGAVEYTLCSVEQDKTYVNLLAKNINDFHIFHYDGPISISDETFYLVDSNDQIIPLSELLKELSSNHCVIMVFAVSEWRGKSERSLDLLLAELVKVAMASGIANVIGFNQISDPWTIAQCTNQLYHNIAKGFTLSQAIVETKKDLQKQTDSTSLSFSSLPFQCWPLLVYYELKPIAFFTGPQIAKDIIQSESYAKTRQKLHGFLSEYIYPHTNIVSDSSAIQCLFSLQNDSAALQLIGSAGQGKTQLLHTLAFYLVQHRYHQAFYFDFSHYHYTPDDISNMIKPIVEANESVAKIQKYVFVFDNIDQLEMSDTAPLNEYIQHLIEQKHQLLITTCNPENPFSIRLVSISLNTLLPDEQVALGAYLIRKKGVDIEGKHMDVLNCLDKCNGNPFVIEKIIPQLKRFSPIELSGELEHWIPQEKISNCVHAYYEWQWQKLDLSWQRWLQLLTDFPDVVVELFSVITDAPEPSDIVRNFNEIIGVEENKKLMDGIGILDEAGFITTYPHGRVINAKCIAIINDKAASDEHFQQHRQELSDLLSRIICKSLALVIPQVLKQSNQTLIHTLLINRARWAQHMERLWQIDQLDEFLPALTALSQLMQQSRLTAELAQWSLHLLCLVPQEAFANRNSQFLSLWIKLAAFSMFKQESAQDQALIKGVKFFDDWLETISNKNEINDNAALFTSVVNFLATFYQQTSQWQLLKSVCEIALNIFKANKVWPLVASHLNIMMECSAQLNDVEAIQEYEHQLLNGIPYDELPPGFKLQINTQLISSRIKGRNFSRAQYLLDETRQLTEVNFQHSMLDALQADIYYQTKQWHDASVLYRKILDSGHAQENAEALQQRIEEVEKHLEKIS